MRKSIHYKFGIGDNVKLKNEERCHNTDWNHVDFENVKDVVFRISGFGWNEDKDGISQYYRLEEIEHLPQQRYLQYNNKISESNLFPVGETHPFDEDIETKSFDGETVRIGMKVYTGLYRHRYQAEPIVNTNFVFASYSEVFKIEKFNGEKEKYHNVWTIREFLCKQENGRDWLDARKFGSRTYDSPNNIVVDVPQDFAQKYVEAYIKNKDKYLEPNNPDCFAVTEYLKHIGVYEEVMKLLNEQKPVEKKPKPIKIERKPYSDKKLLSLTKDLTDEEKRRLKELLS